MKKILILISVVFISLNAKSQYVEHDTKLKEKFGTYVFKGHSLPNFPLHYLKYAKVTKRLNDYVFHKLSEYTEYNLYGDVEGFTIIYRNDGSIDSINFWLRNILIYSADYYKGASKVEKTEYYPLQEYYSYHDDIK